MGLSGDFEWEVIDPGTVVELPAAPPAPTDLAQRVAALSPVVRKRILARIQELQRRKTSMLALYEPMPIQERFHRSQARVRLYDGSNRAGKTVCGMAEVAWIVTNSHPYYKYPTGGVIYIVGRDEDHIADTLCPKLFQEAGGPDGGLRMIRDLTTKQWRAYRPWQDESRFGESRPMPPMIPASLIHGRPSFTKKNRGVMDQVRLKTGWKINFYPGGSDPPQGSSPTYVHLDEEIRNPRWFTEMAARITDKRRRLTWSASAEIGGEALWNMHMLCKADLDKPEAERLFEEFHVTIENNKHIGEQAKREFAEMLKYDPQAYATKVLGQFAVESYRVYPTFDSRIHVVPPFAIPDDWCRYMLVDPGVVACVGLFVAVPPSSDKTHAGHVYVYGEVYLRNTNAAAFADAVKDRIGAQTFEDFIIDYCGSRRTEMGGDSIREQLAEAFAMRRLVCIRRGSNFLEGSDNIDAGIDTIRQWLVPAAHDGVPKLQLLQGMCPNLEMEFLRYHMKRDGNGVLTGKPNQTGIHCCDALRYGALHGMKYVKPIDLSKRKSWAVRRMEEKRKKNPADRSVYLSGGSRRTARV